MAKSTPSRNGRPTPANDKRGGSSRDNQCEKLPPDNKPPFSPDQLRHKFEERDALFREKLQPYWRLQTPFTIADAWASKGWDVSKRDGVLGWYQQRTEEIFAEFSAAIDSWHERAYTQTLDKEKPEQVDIAFERMRGQLALAFVSLLGPDAWWKADWLRKAMSDWWCSGKSSTANRNLKSVTRMMGEGLSSERTRRQLMMHRERLKRRTNSDPHALANAFDSYILWYPYCQQLKKVASEFNALHEYHSFMLWLVFGVRPVAVTDVESLQFFQYESFAYRRIGDCRLPSSGRADIEALFREIRQVLGIRREPNPNGNLNHKHSLLSRVFGTKTREGKRLQTFLAKVPSKTPSRLAAELAARQYNVRVNALQSFVSNWQREQRESGHTR